MIFDLSAFVFDCLHICATCCVYIYIYICIWNCRRVTCMYLMCVYWHRVHFFLLDVQTDTFMHVHAQTDRWSSETIQAHTLSHTHTRTRTHLRVWELTFPCSIFQSTSSLQQPTRDFCIPRIFGAVFAQVACVWERVRLCECAFSFSNTFHRFVFLLFTWRRVVLD